MTIFLHHSTSIGNPKCKTLDNEAGYKVGYKQGYKTGYKANYEAEYDIDYVHLASRRFTWIQVNKHNHIICVCFLYVSTVTVSTSF